MNINDRVKEIQQYFKSLNMVEDTTVVLVKFPDKWKIFNKDELIEKYDVCTGAKENVDGIFFATETDNGVDCIFDAIEEVIHQNKTLEEKAALLEIKARELNDLFISEPIEKLKTLEFTFGTKKPLKKQKNEVKTEIETKDKEEKTSIVEEKVNEKPRQQKQSKNESKNNDDSDVMSFMKEITNGGNK